MSNDNEAGSEAPKKSPRERFFAIDAQMWPKVCGLGMPAAVSYLVLACGSGGDQITTRWSVDAITRHTGIGRPRAKAAIQALAKACVIRIERSGTRPKYAIVHAHEISFTPAPLTSEEQRILGIIENEGRAVVVPRIGRHDNIWNFGKPRETAMSLARKGYLQEKSGGVFTLAAPAKPPEKPDLIWLPCSLVESEGGRPTPVEAIRQSQNIGALQLFIDLYHAHDLINEPGINWRSPHGLRFEYERVKLGQHGEYTVWGFKPKHESVWPSAPFCAPHYDKEGNKAEKFWAALRVLTALHLVAPVAHLVDMDGEHGEVMWPIPMNGAGEDCERAVALAAAEAGFLMLTPGQIEWGKEQGVAVVSPVLSHVGEVKAVGIYRLRHRPHTEATRIWFADLTEQCEGTLQRFQEIISELQPDMQYQGGIKEGSRLNQGEIKDGSKRDQRILIPRKNTRSALTSFGRRRIGGSDRAQETQSRSVSPPFSCRSPSVFQADRNGRLPRPPALPRRAAARRMLGLLARQREQAVIGSLNINTGLA